MDRRPNILLVIVDDLSSCQLGCYGSSYYETPHLDAFAGQGIRFDRAYATGPVCSPARAGIYTGRHPARLHLTNYIPGTVPANPCLITPDWQKGLPVYEQTLGDIFKAQGYETAHIGKWHLGKDYHYEPHRPMDPESHGFDEVFVTRKPKPHFDPEDDAHNVQKLTDRTIAFLRRPRDKPFLCVLAHNTIHRPEMAPSTYLERFQNKIPREMEWIHPTQAAMVAELDDTFGRLMQALDQSNQREDTIVVFTADHGAYADSAVRKPWRGAKSDLYEGGVRVPFLLRWPGGLDGGRVFEGPVSLADLLPTLVDMTGTSLPEVELDGRNLLPALSGGSEIYEPEAFFWHYPHYHHTGLGPCGSALRGRHKLIEWFEGSMGNSNAVSAFELFDLEEDPWEENDLAGEYPELVETLAASLRDWRRRVGAQEMAPNWEFDERRGGQRAEPPPGDRGAPGRAN
ncbi:MAG: sulfatase-like hydrolase/transferase [Opitutae bacterium]|nr:sulfatase-like hydrolase/transferase [Opitutae bacterium]